MNAVRAIAGVIVLLGFVWLVSALFGGGSSASAAPATFSSSNQCAECHQAAHAEWSASEHANSWTGPAVRKLSKEFSNQDCIDCHAPRPIFETGVGNRVLPRTLRRPEGVDCIACHALPEGGVAGSFNSSSAACQPTERIELVSEEFCAGCHNQHLTVDQWRASRYAEEGTSCIDCHMPYRDGDPTKGRDHTMHGGTSLENIRAAIALRGERDGDGWIVEVENVGVGHTFPTDERSRTADVFWRPLGSDGAWLHLHRFRSPYRYETDIDDTLLQAHETRRIAVEAFPDEAPGTLYHGSGQPVTEAIEVALFYKRSPFYDDLGAPEQAEQAVLVHRIELTP